MKVISASSEKFYSIELFFQRIVFLALKITQNISIQYILSKSYFLIKRLKKILEEHLQMHYLLT